MLIARSLQGVGMGMFPIAYTMIRSQFPRNKISIGQGIITSMYASGSVIGLVVGGGIIQYYGWHATFITVIPISIVLLIIIWKFVNVKIIDTTMLITMTVTRIAIMGAIMI